MKKIAVFSFFESYNIGDILIAQRVKEIFSEYNCKYYSITDGKPAIECGLKHKNIKTGNSKSIKSMILETPICGDFVRMYSSLKSKDYLNVLKNCEECETVVFAGGNIIMELNKFPTGIIHFQRIVKGLKANGKKVCFLFAGMGPFKCKKSFKIAKKIFEMSDFISVRDEYSYQTVKKAVPEKEVEIWCDPVLVGNQENLNTKKSNVIGINVYFGNSNKEKKIEKSFVSVINSLLLRFSGHDIVLFSSELNDYRNVLAVKENFPDNERVRIEYADCAEALFAIYSRIDAVLTLRMHTLITAVISGLPAVSVSWQPKVSSFMDLLNNSGLNITLDKFIDDSQTVFEKMVYIIENSDEITEKNFKTIEKLKEETLNKMDKLISVLEG